jgi:hypothetical protein
MSAQAEVLPKWEPSENAIGPQQKALMLQMGRSRAEAQGRRGGDGEGCMRSDVISATGLVGRKREF